MLKYNYILLYLKVSTTIILLASFTLALSFAHCFVLFPNNHLETGNFRVNVLINKNNNNMLIVKYPMQFSGPPKNIGNPCSAPLYADE